MKITITPHQESASNYDWPNWASCSDCMPDARINQVTGEVRIALYDGTDTDYPSNLRIDTTIDEIKSDDEAQQIIVIGTVEVKNWKRWQGSGVQKFVYVFFVGDSGAIYFHRSPATKTWLEATPAFVRDRLRCLGDRRAKRCGVVQQGDILLIPATKKEEKTCQFMHETKAIGHHVFPAPVLYCDMGGDRFLKIVEAINLIHQPATGFVHPTIEVPVGCYIVSKTANSLENGRKD